MTEESCLVALIVIGEQVSISTVAMSVGVGGSSFGCVDIFASSTWWLG